MKNHLILVLVYFLFVTLLFGCSNENNSAISPSPQPTSTPTICQHEYDGIICKKCRKIINCNEQQKVLLLDYKIAKANNLSFSGDVVIPEKIEYKGETYTVGGIGSGVFAMSGLFQNNIDIKSVTLPNTCRVIQDFAFDECSNLKTVNMNDELLYIGKAAFQLCASLQELPLPDSVEYIGDSALVIANLLIWIV